MCGIVGIVDEKGAEWIGRMNEAISHRGPDDEGFYQSPDHRVSLAMRRLSILDLEGGHQPMSDQSGRVWIVFNGEIFNAPELRARLEEKGRRFQTRNSDTEVLLQLYLEKGPDFLSDLNGMFAFVIHDQRKKLLFGARDRMGIKPLYYWSEGGRFAFASELKALVQLPFVSRDPDPQSLFHYMTLLYVPDHASILQGVFRVPPGHCFSYDLDARSLDLKQYWKLVSSPIQGRREGEWMEVLRMELLAAVKRWTLSDVPIACSLSGGVDSSALVGLLAQQGLGQVKTYSLGFSGKGESEFDETALARQVAQRWNTDHHEIILKPEELLDDLLSMVWFLDEPYGGGLPSWYVYREMSRDVKVGLTGTGGDELFGNYGKFSVFESNPILREAVSFRRRHPVGARLAAALVRPFGALTTFFPSKIPWIGRGRRLSQLTRLFSEPFGANYYANFAYLSDAEKHEFVFSTMLGPVQRTASYLQALYDASGSPDLRNGLAAVDFRTQLAEEFLFMTDRFSMAHSLEARVPFLDHQLVELVYQIPSNIRTNTKDLKYLFRGAVKDLLPSDIASAPKRGFVIPIGLWLRRELRPLTERLLAPSRLAKQGIFKKEFYSQFVEPHLSGKANYTEQVWAAVMYQLWHALFLERSSLTAPSSSWRDLC